MTIMHVQNKLPNPFHRAVGATQEAQGLTSKTGLVAILPSETAHIPLKAIHKQDVNSFEDMLTPVGIS